MQFIIALSLSSISVGKRLNLYYEVKRLHAVLRYAQRKALIERIPCVVELDFARRSYSLDHEYAMHPDVIFGAQQGVFGPPSSPHNPITDASTWPHKKIVFYPPDHPLSSAGSTTSGSVYLTDSGRSCTYALTCDASYGSILRCYHYSKGWKLLS